MICLDERYSTTRCVTTEKPEIIKKPQDKFETLLFLPPGEGRKGEGGLRTRGYFKKSYPNKPLISVITVVLNGEKYLEETILSVLNQTYDNVEYIIIDGGSTDGTLDLIKKYEHAIDYWVSEKDRGIYDAMNKGIVLATGDWINFMNAGDGFYDTESILKIFTESIEEVYGVIYGDTLIIYNNKLQRISKALPIENINYGMVFSHQSCFTRSHICKTKKFSLDFRFAADFHFFISLYKEGVCFLYFPEVISYMRAGGLSDTYRLKVISEYEIISKQYENNTKISLAFLFKKIDQKARIIIKKLIPNYMTEFIIRIMKYRKHAECNKRA